MSKYTLPRKRFKEDFPSLTASDHSGLDILMADSLNILVKYINREDAKQSLPTFISEHQDLSLYSGGLEYVAPQRRRLESGVRFFHGNEYLEFMTWDNNCDGIYCPITVSTGE